jgi:spermidine/putrescine transport system permease protein
MQKVDGIEPPNSLGRRLLGTFTVLVYVFLYLPIGVVILLSFSPSEIATFPLEGLSFQWYANLIPPNHDSQLVSALVRSLILGSIAVVGAAIVGTLAALGIVRGSFRFLSGRALNMAFLLPVLIPWIVSGIAVLTLFTYLNVNGTFLSLIAGHILITLPFVVLIVGNRLRGLDRSIEEAAMNLGASRLKTFREVTFPLIFPAIAASVLIAFTFSFDNFIQTYFWATSEYQTLPLVIFSRIQHGFTPTINAISTVIVVFSVTISLLGEWLYGFTTSTGEETE